MTATLGLIITALVFGGLLFVVGRYFSLWLQAYVTGARIALLSLILMTEPDRETAARQVGL